MPYKLVDSESWQAGINEKSLLVSNGFGNKTIYTKRNESEKGDLEDDGFDPFRERVLEHPVSETDTLIHLLKSCFGTGILAMPIAFKSAGFLVGVVATLVVSVICCHCAYILVQSAHELYKRNRQTTLTFSDIAKEACASGPPWCRRYGSLAKTCVEIGLFVTYFGASSAYTVILAKTFEKVTEYYLGSVDIRLYLLILLVPLLLLCYIPNLKYLTPVSMLTNVFMATGILITCYFLVTDLPSMEGKPMSADIEEFPIFFSITIFALEAIGVIMPLENNMSRPQKFIGIFGVLNQGMAGVTIMYILVGFLGYLRFGDLTEANITLNLPIDNYAAQAVQLLIGLATFGTFGIQYFVALDIGWKAIEHRFKTRPIFANYVLRTVILFAAVLLAIAVPTIGPFISLIGALCLSILGLIIPILIKILTFWDQGFGKYRWRLFKDGIVILTGVFALIFGTRSAVEEIVDMYVGDGSSLKNGTYLSNTTNSSI